MVDGAPVVAFSSKKKKKHASAFDGVSTNRAYELVHDTIINQISRAVQLRTPPNVSIVGDAAIRRTATALLPASMLRRIFLDLVAIRGGIERARSLFGAPPYIFLLPEDAALLNAGGFASSRKNMAYDRPNSVPNYSQFGMALCTDTKGRQFRTFDLHQQEAHVQGDLPIGFSGFLYQLYNNFSEGVDLVCRMPRPDHKRRADGSLKSTTPIVHLPTTNETIILSPIDSPTNVATNSRPVVVRVRAIRLPERKSMNMGGSMPATCIIRVSSTEGE